MLRTKIILPEGYKDSIINVDRSKDIICPSFVKRLVKIPENTNPTTYNILDLELLFLEKQKEKSVFGLQIYKEFKGKPKEDKILLKSCLDLNDGQAIIAKGPKFFDNVFNGYAVFLWRNIGIDKVGFKHVAYLASDGNNVFISWTRLMFKFHSNCPAIVFKSDYK